MFRSLIMLREMSESNEKLSRNQKLRSNRILYCICFHTFRGLSLINLKSGVLSRPLSWHAAFETLSHSESDRCLYLIFHVRKCKYVIERNTERAGELLSRESIIMLGLEKYLCNYISCFSQTNAREFIKV